MSLYLPRALRSTLETWAREGYPAEVCGMPKRFPNKRPHEWLGGAIATPQCREGAQHTTSRRRKNATGASLQKHRQRRLLDNASRVEVPHTTADSAFNFQCRTRG